MRLSVILEVANPRLTSMDGVEVSVSGSGTVKYNFSDPNVPDKEYIVEFAVASDRLQAYNFRNDPVYTYLKMSNPGSGSYSLSLKSEDVDNERYADAFAKTGKGNFGFVYGKLMACIIDFFVTRKNKVLFLYFTGYTRDMELVYKRIMDRLNNEYPALVMRPYEPEALPETDFLGYYVSLNAIENIEDDNMKQQAYNNIQGLKHAAKIGKIRELKKTKDSKYGSEIYV